MNLIAAVSILLVTILTFQTTVTNGAKSLVEHKQHSSSSKEHLTLASVSDGGGDGSDRLVRKGRGAKSAALNQGGSETTNNNGGGSGVGKRGKNSKKLNKSTHLENSNAPASSAQSMSSDKISEERTKLPQHDEQKSASSSTSSSSSSSSSSMGHQHNNKPKQRQMLKAQQHQTHVKRGGGNAKSVGEKKSEEQKQTSCRYSKSAWTECDTKTNSRSRTLTLKKGESSCQQTRTIQKKCKKACRYEKGVWTECASGQMTRQDKLKTTSDATCEAVRAINKKCNPGGGKKDKGNKERKNKDKSSRKAAAA